MIIYREDYMQDLLNDIKKLKDVKEMVGLYSVSTIQSFLQDIIDEKQKEVDLITKKDNQRAFNDYLKGGKSWVE